MRDFIGIFLVIWGVLAMIAVGFAVDYRLGWAAVAALAIRLGHVMLSD